MIPRYYWSLGCLLGLVAGCTGVIGNPAAGGPDQPGAGSTSAGSGSGSTGGPGGTTGPGGTGSTTGMLPPGTMAEPGRVTVRRLNQPEYDNTVHDLLGTDTHPALTITSDRHANG